MANNSQKTYLGRTLNRFAERKIVSAIQLLGKALPCSVVSVSGSIVVVQFEIQSGFTLPQVTVPIIGPEYIRYPIQPGCLGEVQPADARIGNVTGLGSAAAPGLDTPANLSALCFVPLGNANWSPPDDPNAVVIYGPNGVILRDSGSTCKITLVPGGVVIELPSGGNLTVDASGGGNVQVIGGDVTADSISLKTHVHSGVTTGSGDTGPPVP